MSASTSTAASPSPDGAPPTITLHTGAKLPLLGFGTWGGGDDAAKLKAAVTEAIRVGYRHIDCAEMYMNQREIGEAIAESIKAGVVKREELFVTSKVWNTNHAPENVKASCVRTLQHLQLDYLDLLLVHWPLNWKHAGELESFDQAFPKDSKGHLVDEHGVSLKDTWQAFEKLVDEKLVRHIGISNYTNILTNDLLRYARIPPAVNQVELHPYLCQEELVHYHQMKGIHVSAYSPLGRAGKVGGKRGEEIAVIHDKLIKHIADELNKQHGLAGDQAITPGHVLLRWNIQRDVSVLPKSSTPARIRSNYELLGKFGLTKEQMVAISSLDRGFRYNELDILEGRIGPSKYPVLYEGHILQDDEKEEKK